VDKIIKSLVTTAVVSAAFGLTGLLFQLSFLGVFVITTIVQFILFFIIGSFADYLGQLKIREIETQQLKELNKSFIDVECPCDKKVIESVQVKLGERNTYVCRDCGKLNAIYLNATSAATNVPIIKEKDIVKENGI